MRLRKHYSHHVRRYLMAPPTLTAWTHPCPLLALISISWLWPNPVINEHVIVSTIGCHPPAQSSSSLSCQNPALSSSVIDHVYLKPASCNPVSLCHLSVRLTITVCLSNWTDPYLLQLQAVCVAGSLGLCCRHLWTLLVQSPPGWNWTCQQGLS